MKYGALGNNNNNLNSGALFYLNLISIMPLLAFVLSKIFNLDSALMAGVILVGTCPGGTSSNVITYLSGGDVALSVGMTSGLIILLVVILHNILGYLIGFMLGKILKLDVPKIKALSIEIGMQNSGLATSLALSSFPNLTLATVPGALFSVWHNISGAILSAIYRKWRN